LQSLPAEEMVSIRRRDKVVRVAGEDGALDRRAYVNGIVRQAAQRVDHLGEEALRDATRVEPEPTPGQSEHSGSDGPAGDA
jgi:hypothetical protein